MSTSIKIAKDRCQAKISLTKIDRAWEEGVWAQFKDEARVR